MQGHLFQSSLNLLSALLPMCRINKKKTFPMKKPSFKQTGLAIAVLILFIGFVVWSIATDHLEYASRTQPTASTTQKASLTVTTIKPQITDWPVVLTANGSIAAWQEAVIGSELGGLRLDDVAVNVGDVVRRGQVLARFANESVMAEVAQQEAAEEEARAAFSEAKSNAERARMLATSGALSAQQMTQYATAERSTQVRLMSAQARLRIEQIRLRQTTVIAPDDGVISSRTATVGSVTSQGQELFKLIRKNRLEWRAEVASGDLPRIKPGQVVKLLAANGAKVDGKVRMIAPTADQATRNTVVYVDLPYGCDAHAGMFATGEFELGRSQAITVPQSAVVTHDGFNYVYRVGPDGKVTQTKVMLGRRVADRIDVIDGVTAAMTLVAQGAGLLADGDTVKVVAAPVIPVVPVTPTAATVSPLASR